MPKELSIQNIIAHKSFENASRSTSDVLQSFLEIMPIKFLESIFSNIHEGELIRINKLSPN